MGDSADGGHPELDLDFRPDYGIRTDAVNEMRAVVAGDVKWSADLLEAPAEIVIAEIWLRSVHRETVFLSGSWKDGIFQYRIHGDDVGDLVRMEPAVSNLPLTFKELVNLLRTIRFNDGDADRGPYIDASREHHDDLEVGLRFVEVESTVYPQLEAFFRADAQRWYDEKVRARMESCPDCHQLFDPWKEHECPEQKARLEQEAMERRERERKIEPFRTEIDRIVDAWRGKNPGGPGAAGMEGRAAAARAAALNRFLKDYALEWGELPDGEHSIEWWFIDDQLREFMVDFGSLA